MSEIQEKWYIDRMTVPETFYRNVARFSHRRFQWWRPDPASTETRSLTYGEVERIVRELSAGLMSLGFQKGDRAAIMGHTAPEWLWADYAIQCAAGITVCIYPTQSEKELSYIVNDSGAKILFVHNNDILEKVLHAEDSMECLGYIVVMREKYESAHPRIIDLGRLRRLGVKALSEDRYCYEKRWKSVKLTDPMTIVYTSGTTDLPKGVLQTHLSFNAACCRDTRIVPPYREGDVLMSFLPLAHTYERECGHGTAAMAGATIAYSSPATLVEDFQIFRPHVFMSVPRIYERIYMAMRSQASKSPVKKWIFEKALETGLRVVNSRADENGFIDMSEGIDLTKGAGFWLRFKFRLYDRILFSKVRKMLGGRYRFAFSAAGSLPADLCKTFMAMGVRIFEGYGATETWNTINLNLPSRILPGSVGPVCVGVEGRIADDGEWQVRGDNVFVGYWNNPAATEKAFTEDGFYKTGDIVEMVADGYIRIVDRKNGLMVLDTGKNVPSNKIEGLFSISPWVEMVVPVGSERKFVTALVVPRFDAFIQLFDEKGMEYNSSAIEYVLEPAPMCVKVGRDFVEKEEVRRLVDEDIRRANESLEEYEQIKRYYIVNRRLSDSLGELTPTLKVKRRVVLDHFSGEIESMYEAV